MSNPCSSFNMRPLLSSAATVGPHLTVTGTSWPHSWPRNRIVDSSWSRGSSPSSTPRSNTAIEHFLASHYHRHCCCCCSPSGSATAECTFRSCPSRASPAMRETRNVIRPSVTGYRQTYECNFFGRTKNKFLLFPHYPISRGKF